MISNKKKHIIMLRNSVHWWSMVRDAIRHGSYGKYCAAIVSKLSE